MSWGKFTERRRNRLGQGTIGSAAGPPAAGPFGWVRQMRHGIAAPGFELRTQRVELRTALRDDPAEVRRARHLVGSSLDRWGVPDESGVAALLVSELVTNALRYGDQPMRLVARRAEHGVRVEVHDGRPSDPPRVRNPSPESPTGRGMLLVDALAARWGWSEGGGRKQVWFELDTI